MRKHRFLASFFVALLAAASARADIQITLKNAFIEAQKNKATVTATFTVDKAPTKIHPQKDDGEIHIAGRAPEVQLPIVAEVTNARDLPNVFARVKQDAAANKTLTATGAWRMWCEHAGMDAQIQGLKLDRFDTTNPEHVFEIHPLLQYGDINLSSTWHPISGYEPKEAERAFMTYENLRCRISRHGSTTTITTSMAGMNFVEFQLRLNEKPHKVDDGYFVMAKVETLDGDLLVHKRRMVFVDHTPPADKVKTLTKGDCIHVLGVPRINLALVSWRVEHSSERPEVLDWNLPYEIIVVGLYPGACNDPDEE